MQDETIKTHGMRCGGWCICGERFDKFFGDAGRIYQTCMGGGKWEDEPRAERPRLPGGDR